MRILVGAAAVACLVSQPVWAVFDLQITEIWPGNEPGENQTGDWFEVTNVGDMDWTSAAGTLYFDDSSPSAENADEIFGVSTIAAGESVVFVDDDNSDPFLATEIIWKGLWTGPLTAAGQSVPQVGYYAGSGLSGGGDEVNLFLDTDGTLEDTDLIATASYVDADAFGGRSWDVVNSLYSGSSYAVVTGVNDMGNPSTGTPGFAPIVPEPTACALLAIAAGMAGLGRRR